MPRSQSPCCLVIPSRSEQHARCQYVILNNVLSQSPGQAFADSKSNLGSQRPEGMKEIGLRMMCLQVQSEQCVLNRGGGNDRGENSSNLHRGIPCSLETLKCPLGDSDLCLVCGRLRCHSKLLLKEGKHIFNPLTARTGILV